MPHHAPRPRARPRVFLALAAGALTAAVLAACGASDGPPPRSPLDDGGAPPATATAAGAFPTPIPTGPADGAATATPGVGAGAGTPEPANGAGEGPLTDAEHATARAIETMAEYLGIPATALTLQSSEAVDWSDACIGVYYPGSACAEVITPGYEVVLRDAFFNLHTLHADTEGRFAWPGEEEASGLVASVDVSAGLVTIESADGEATFRRVPGSRIGGEGLSLADLEPGAPVAVAYDRSPSGGEVPVIAWLMPEE